MAERKVRLTAELRVGPGAVWRAGKWDARSVVMDGRRVGHTAASMAGPLAEQLAVSMAGR